MEYVYLMTKPSLLVCPALPSARQVRSLYTARKDILCLYLRITLGLAYTGTLPSEIGLLTALKYLGIVLTNLNGTIPSEIGNLSQLTILRLHDNLLQG